MSSESDETIENQSLTRDKVRSSHTWYIRKNNKITGPFPVGQISQLLVVGRLSVSDEISHDKDQWVDISSVPNIIPDVLNAEGDSDQNERLAAARRWADERREERRELNTKTPSRQTHGRRSNESLEEIEYRNRRESIYRSFREKPKRSFFAATIFLLIVAVLVGGAFNYAPLMLVDEPDCSALPTIGVNWRNCNKSEYVAIRKDLSQANLHSTILRGANMFASKFSLSRMDYSNFSNANVSYANFTRANLKGASFKDSDLRHANFTSANLTYVDFTNASIDNVIFSKADLSNAIWIDGRKCLVKSIGFCRFK